MKMVFLFQKELWPEIKKGEVVEEKLPEFFAWKYGPFSSDVLNDLEFLINWNFVQIKSGNRATDEELEEYEYWLDDSGQEDADDEYISEEFFLTDKGNDKALEAWNELLESQKEAIGHYRDIMTSTPLNKILEYVYKKYKDGYTEKSLIRDRYLVSK